jgi:hypothetical protein
MLLMQLSFSLVCLQTTFGLEARMIAGFSSPRLLIRGPCLPCLLVVGCFFSSQRCLHVCSGAGGGARSPASGTMGFVGRSRHTQDDLQLVRWYSYTSIALCRHVPSTRLHAFKIESSCCDQQPPRLVQKKPHLGPASVDSFASCEPLRSPLTSFSTVSSPSSSSHRSKPPTTPEKCISPPPPSSPSQEPFYCQ